MTEGICLGCFFKGIASSWVLAKTCFVVCEFVDELLVWFLCRASFEMTKGFLDFLMFRFFAFISTALNVTALNGMFCLFVYFLMSCLCGFLVVPSSK